jgi:capsular exopolysaccharide synthesis family protein
MNGNDTVQLVDYLRAIRRRWWLVALLAIVTTAAALAVSLSAEKQYDATAAVLLENEQPVNSLLTPGANFSPADPVRQLNTDVELIEAAATAFAAKRLLAIDRSVDALLEQVETDVSSTSDIVDITARDTEPLVAARIANAFAEAYVASRAQSARERYIEAAQLAERQLQTLSEGERSSPQGLELQARQRELEIAAALQTAGAEIVRRASVPESPARPRPMLSGALGLGLGLLLGIAAALARELFDRRLKSEEAVESFFELPILASIPRPSRRGDDHAQREAYGLLAANLRFTSLNRESNVVMVTSASPGEGKTTVTLGLGRALARLGLRVIAIEADLRRPTFSAWAPVGSRRGLSAVLTGSGLSRELVWLDVDTLEPVPAANAADGSAFAMLPAGELPENPQHLLAQPTMQAVIQGCRAIADVVLIDTPPIGTVNDPATLARHVDAVALVVRLDQTTKDAARRAQRVLRNADVDLPGIVLTGAGGTQGYGYYGPVAPAKSTPSRLNAELPEALEGTGRSRPEGEHLPRLEGRRR